MVNIRDVLVEEDVVLRAHPQRQADGVHVCADVSAVDEGRSRGGREHASQDGPEIHTQWRKAMFSLHRRISTLFSRVCELHRSTLHGGGLPRSIVAQKGSDLALVKADAESVHGWSGAAAEHLDQVLDFHTLHQVGRLRFEEGVACTAQTTGWALPQTLAVVSAVVFHCLVFSVWRNTATYEVRGLECHSVGAKIHFYHSLTECVAKQRE